MEKETKFKVYGNISLIEAYRKELLQMNFNELGGSFINMPGMFDHLEVRNIYNNTCEFIALSNLNGHPEIKKYHLNTQWDKAIQAARELTVKSEEDIALELAKPYIEKGYVPGAIVNFVKNNTKWKIVEFPSKFESSGSYFQDGLKDAANLIIQVRRVDDTSEIKYTCTGRLKDNELYTSELVEIGSYISHYEHGCVSFGCQTFTRSQILAIRGNLDDISKDKLDIILKNI